MIPETILKSLRVIPIRSSSISTLEECPRKFLYRDRLGIKPTGYQSAFSIGTMFHKALQSYFTGGSAADRAALLDRLSLDQTNSLIALANPVGLLPDGSDVLTVSREIDDDRHKALAMAETFIQFHPFDLDKWDVLRTPYGDPVVELILETRVEGLTQPIRSPCDLALIKKGTNEVWIVDHKTTSMSPKVRAAALQISTQAKLYRLVLQSNLDLWYSGGTVGDGWVGPPLQVMGSIHNIIKKPTIKYCPDTKDKGGFHKYVERMQEWYKANDDTMIQAFTRLSGPVLDDELLTRLLRVDVGSSWMEPSLDKFYRAGDYVCHTFNRPCPYLPLCTSAPVQWPDLVRSQYVVEFREDAEESAYRRE
jgi:hypothetical protein